MNESNTLAAADVRRFPIPENIEVLWLFDSDAYLKAHHTYRAAKAGDSKSALGRNKSFTPDRRTVKTLKERFANEIIETFGIHVDELTANEAQYLVGFRSADELRNRLAKAKQEVDIRLRSKGIAGIFGTQDRQT